MSAPTDPTGPTDSRGLRGILAPVALLDRWLQVVLVALVATCAVRYVDRHGLDALGVAILAGAAVLALAYATRAALPGLSWWPTVWVAGMVAIWAGLTVVAPSFAWCAVPVAFAVLRVLPFGWAAATVVAMTLLVAGSTTRISDSPDPTLLVGPVGVAIVTVIAYRSLERESRARQDLLDELGEAQAELAEEQHRSGALAERTRLSREIHDSVGQGLSSINLLLQAAERAWDDQPLAAREHVRTAAATARDGLEEVRHVVRDLAPAELGDGSGDALAGALRRAADQAVPGLAVEVRVDGGPVPLRPEVAAALLRTTRGALANVREHAGAGRVAVTLTYLGDEVLLDVRDDGRGFAPWQGRGPQGFRGHGLRGIRDRAAALGGTAEVESAPGEGTTVSVRFPV
ncbi:sensor histidine kinase [Nocardioides antri]|uniref:Sensor histidine kinase n=1 Tax=Nocardioides antri TaxID=2607659 RepID=A0A5B1M274_9ACTN|nr:sensor histidine kinase [Nocardioides antri]KAA1426716.1 sensor histidine kinase [Nocardioides antri]